MTSAPSISEQRRRIAGLLDDASAADAVAAYYALYHDERRTRLWLHTADGSTGRPDGFLAVCRTGMDLFRPLAVLRAPDERAARELLEAGLAPGRPHFLIAPLALREALLAAVAVSEPAVYCVYTVDASALRPVINVLVQSEATPEGGRRWVIRSTGGDAVAVAGINWRSPRWAEVYAQVAPAARGRGLGRSVVSACTAWLLDQGLRPLYLAAEDHTDSLALAAALGYRDTRARQFMGLISGPQAAAGNAAPEPGVASNPAR